MNSTLLIITLSYVTLHFNIILFLPAVEFERPVVVDVCVGKRGDVPVG